MPISAQELIDHHLEAGISDLERASECGAYNIFTLRSFAAGAKVLGREKVLARALTLLRAVPDHAFFAGAIANFELPATAANSLRTIESLELLEKSHPPFNQAVILDRIRSNREEDEHLALCLTGRWREAVGRGLRDRCLEEIGSILAILGEWDAALSVACDPSLEEFRQKGVIFVLVIEMFRRGLVERSLEQLARFHELPGADFRVQLALGFAGRVPWGGYPFPDW